jgi:hypothetical protein
MAENIKRPIFVLKCGADYVTSDLSLTGNINFAIQFRSEMVAQTYLYEMERKLETMEHIEVIPAEVTINEKN